MNTLVYQTKEWTRYFQSIDVDFEYKFIKFSDWGFGISIRASGKSLEMGHFYPGVDINKTLEGFSKELVRHDKEGWIEGFRESFMEFSKTEDFKAYSIIES